MELATEQWTQVHTLIILIRVMHAFLLAMHALRVLTDNEENELLHQILRAFEVVVYLGLIMYVQFHLNSHPPAHNMPLWTL